MSASQAHTCNQVDARPGLGKSGVSNGNAAILSITKDALDDVGLSEGRQSKSLYFATNTEDQMAWTPFTRRHDDRSRMR